jgi:hypothetical protein
VFSGLAGHADGKCSCHLPIMHWGHDEAVFWVNLLSGNEWVIDGEVRDHQCQRHHANIVQICNRRNKE